MAKTILAFLPLVLSALSLAGAAAPATTSFITASCRETEYPPVCMESLSAYASAVKQSPKELAQAALTVSLARAESTRAFVKKLTKFKGLKPREYQALKDCADEIDDTVDRIGRSVTEMKAMGSGKSKEFLWHISNVETWVSAALTDENTCSDGFAGKAMDGRIKASVKAKVTNVAQVTSNALALINKFAAKY
ncbi:Pectinesterase [Bertholletia excelsa]